MKRTVLYIAVILVLIVSNLWAMDYLSWWKQTHDNLKNFWAEGMIAGLKWGKVIEEITEEKDARQRMMLNVYSEVTKIDSKAVVRVMAEFYKDSANAQLSPEVVFFPAAAKLMGYPEEEIAEVLRKLRESQSKI